MPVVLFAGGPGLAVGPFAGNATLPAGNTPPGALMPLIFGVSDIEAHVEVLGDVPLGSRADPPPVPVVVATGRGHRIGPPPAPAPEPCAVQRMALA